MAKYFTPHVPLGPAIFDGVRLLEDRLILAPLPPFGRTSFGSSSNRHP